MRTQRSGESSSAKTQDTKEAERGRCLVGSCRVGGVRLVEDDVAHRNRGLNDWHCQQSTELAVALILSEEG